MKLKVGDILMIDYGDFGWSDHDTLGPYKVIKDYSTEELAQDATGNTKPGPCFQKWIEATGVFEMITVQRWYAGIDATRGRLVP